jgi:serine/threonine protein phosphatase PrpC
MSLDVGNDGKTGFFAVFDGHGGKEVAKFVALKMVGILAVS